MADEEQLDERIKSIEIMERFRGLSLQELENHRITLSAKLSHISGKISDLAFNNYRTYANAGRTAEQSIEMFSNINKEMSALKEQYPTMLQSVEQFDSLAEQLYTEFTQIDDASDDTSAVWALLDLTKLMDRSIRAGYYDSAYALSTFAQNMQQSKLDDNRIVKNILNTLIESRHDLLDVLFNKFDGPIDLAESVKIANNIRKIPYISSTQLRVSLLQYRDIYLEKNIMALMTEPDFGVNIIDAYLKCMYDTCVLYTAVFPDSEQQRNKTSDDSNWERWTSSSQSFLLQSWAHRNLDTMFERIRSSEQRSPIDMNTMCGKLMFFAYSFEQYGLDFRPLIINELMQIVGETFSTRITKITETLVSAKQISLLDNDIFESSKANIEKQWSGNETTETLALIELCVWDELCVYGNGIIDALNEMRHFVSPVFCNEVFAVLNSSLETVHNWIKSLSSPTDAATVSKATTLFIDNLVPYINRCFQSIFSYNDTLKPYYANSVSLDEYLANYTFLPHTVKTAVSSTVEAVSKINILPDDNTDEGLAVA